MIQYQFTRAQIIDALSSCNCNVNTKNIDAARDLVGAIQFGSSPSIAVQGVSRYINHNNADLTYKVAWHLATVRCLEQKPKIIKYVYKHLSPYWRKKLQEFLIK